MVQVPLFDAPEPSGPRHYLIDTNSIMEIDGAHDDEKPSVYTTDEQGLIWSGLVALFEAKRARMVSYAKGELSHWNPTAYETLRRFPAVQETNPLVLVYQDVNERFPNWVDEDGDPADPWIVAYAALHRWRIVTEEKRAAEQSSRRRRPKIPDAADYYKVRCLTVADLIRDEGWL